MDFEFTKKECSRKLKMVNIDFEKVSNSIMSLIADVHKKEVPCCDLMYGWRNEIVDEVLDDILLEKKEELVQSTLLLKESILNNDKSKILQLCYLEKIRDIALLNTLSVEKINFVKGVLNELCTMYYLMYDELYL